MTLDEIKQLMAAGDTAQADEALKELLANESDNLQAKMLYGTCRQLLGDEETFKRIHDELAPEMANMEQIEPKTETVSLWKKYHALWMTLIVGGLVLAGVITIAWFGKNTTEQLHTKYGPAIMPEGVRSYYDRQVPQQLEMQHEKEVRKHFGEHFGKIMIPEKDKAVTK